ncbi:glycosyltransferase [Aureimonas sp. AU4]|uniref:glycosyltransferase n=1 Tax=Aureimonas sp. AU4 TaxID=1638163 RepID=UPI000783C24A|nr:glycosyltransferase [Aureimonas sp. AU4]
MDWTELLHADPMLADPARQGEALIRNASRLLRESRPEAAVRLLDRRLQVSPPAAPAERALAALAANLSGREDEVAEALGGALGADPIDPAVCLAALRLARGAPERREAARRLLASPVAPDDARLSALGALFAAGAEAATRLELRDGQLSGWVAWRGEPASRLVLLHPEGEEIHHALHVERGPTFAPAGGAVAFLALRIGRPVAGFEIRRGATVLDAGPLAARSRDGPALPAPCAPQAVPEPRPVRIVVPVFGDPDSAADALCAAIREARRLPGTEIVVVDDASPSEALRDLVDALAGRGLIELRRNAVNLGFTGAVALGLEGIEARDALILNSDAILPRGALERLREAVYAAPDIGSATPLSNNGEWTSVPRLGMAAPFPAPGEARRLDEAAQRAAGSPVDLPNGIGFALYLRHDALQAAGGFSAVYERGYFEDAELTLRLRAAGFRNVAAASLLVPHHGSRSFGTEKAALVARNLRRLRRRFPGLRDESAAFRRADPLAPARAAVEREAVPAGYPILVVAPTGSALAAERLLRHEAAGRVAVLLRWRRVGPSLRAELRGAGATAPQSLAFDLPAEAALLRDWLRRLDPERLELAGGPPPEPLAETILAVPGAITLLAGDLAGRDLEASSLLDSFERWRECLGDRWLAVAACDRATLAALRQRLAGSADAARIEADLPDARRRTAGTSGSPPVLALLLGVPAPRSHAFALRLQAALRARLGPSARCTTFGPGLDDLALIRAGIDAQGTVPPDRFEARLRESGARALILPPADPSLALFDRLAAETALPTARLDWSEGAETPSAPSLLLPRSHGEPDIVRAVVDWFAGRLAP